MAEFTKEELQAELELRKRNKPSDEIDAVIASLTNDEGARIEYLKRKRFPDNPNVIYFKDEDNDLAYIDPTTKEIKKEFREYNDWVDSYDIFGSGVEMPRMFIVFPLYPPSSPRIPPTISAPTCTAGIILPKIS